MIIKKFVDKDSRSAMARVREEFGAEAVVLSTREVSAGFEMVAAANYDDYDIGRELSDTGGDPFGEVETEESVSKVGGRSSPAKESVADVVFQPQPVIQTSLSYVAEIPEAANKTSENEKTSEEQDIPTLQTLQTELSQLRHLMEKELSKFSKRSKNTGVAKLGKARASMKRHLVKAGFSESLSEELVDKLDLRAEGTAKWRRVVDTLAKRIRPCSNDLLTQGGIAAFVGQTGVGKTTVIAKIAMNKLLSDGKDTVGLISASGIRDPKNTRLLDFADATGIACLESHNATGLKSAIEEFSSKDLVLIDTQGMGENDLRLVIQSAEFRIVDHQIDSYLVLSGESDLPSLLSTVDLFKRYSPVGVVLTKLDTSKSLSECVEALAISKLPIGYLCDGDEIPSDIRLGAPKELIKLALKKSYENSSQRSREFLDKPNVAHLSAIAAKQTKQANRLAAGI